MSEGIVLYTDGSFRHKRCGWGIHGYTYTNEPYKVIPTVGWKVTPEGYASKTSPDDALTPTSVIEGFGNIEGRGSNILAEIVALQKGLEFLAAHPEFETATIRTDSEYAIKTLTTYLPKWRSANWRKSDGSEAAHVELWKEVDRVYQEVMTRKSFTLKHVKGHEGEYGNEAADTMARLGSGEIGAYHWSTRPYDDYIASFKNDTYHPLIQRSRLVFNVGGEERPGVYYNYRLGKSGKASTRPEDSMLEKLRKSEAYLGAWLADQTFSVIRLDEPEPMIEKALAVHRAEFARNTIDIGVLRVDTLYGKEMLATFDRLGRDAVSAYQADRALINHKDDCLTRTLTPPQRAYDAVTEFVRLERHLDEYLADTLAASCIKVDLSSTVFESHQKSEKAKVTWSAAKAIDKAKFLDVTIPAIDGKVRLLMGVDIPDRNALNRLAGPDTKVEVLVWTEGKRYYYEVVVIAPGCTAIYSSPQVSYILK